MARFKFPVSGGACPECCCKSGCPSCGYCTDGAAPEDVTVTIASGPLAGSYTLPDVCPLQEAPCVQCGAVPNCCQWRDTFTIAGSPVTFNFWTCQITNVPTPGPIVYLLITGTNIGFTPWWAVYSSLWANPEYNVSNNQYPCVGCAITPEPTPYVGPPPAGFFVVVGAAGTACASGWTLQAGAFSAISPKGCAVGCATIAGSGYATPPTLPNTIGVA